jgi:5-formaminoimidazole-4-carboxamide-1-beta-D-ribofuranosyl 5'-monophosphate synthetase
MIDILFENIQEHLTMLDLAVHSSEKIRDFAKNENLEAVVSETENRERIINIVTQIQRKVEEQINLLDAGDVSQDGILILKAWFQDLSVLSERMLVCDRETVEFLGQQKDETTKEIAVIFKNKAVFKGYNHEGKK